MPIIDPHKKRRRVIRLSILAAVLLVCAGGLYGLHQYNSARQQLTTDEVIEHAKQAADNGNDLRVIELLEDAGSPTSTIPAIQDDAELLQIYITARLNTPLVRGEHLQHAAAAMRKHVALEPDNTEARSELFSLLITMDRTSEVLQLAEQLAEQFPDDAELKRYLGSAQLKLGNKESALETYRQAIEIDPLDVRTQSAIIGLVQDDPAERDRFAKQAQALHQANPEDPRAELILALAKQAAGDSHAARELLQSAINKPAPTDTFVQVAIGLMDRLNLFALSATYLKQLAPKDIETYPGREAVMRAFDLGDDRRALSILENADPDVTPTHLLALWAIALHRIDDTKQAEHLIDQLDRREDAAARAWVRLLPIYMDKRATPGALIQAFDTLLADEAFAADAEDLRHQPYIMQLIAEAHLAIGKTESAIEAMSVAAEQHPTWSRPHALLAQTLMSIGQPEQALPYAEMALLRQPNASTSALHTLAMLAATDPRSPTAVKRAVLRADKFLERRPNNARVIGGVISLLAQAGQMSAATQRFEAVVGKDYAKADPTGKAPIFDHYSRALVRVGKINEAWSLLGPHLNEAPEIRGVALARVRLDLNNPQTATQWLQAINQVKTTDKAELLERARAAFWAGTRLQDKALRQSAMQLLQPLLEMTGTHPADAYYLHGQIAYELGDLTGAEASFRQVHASMPDAPAVLNYLAIVLADQGRSLDEAEQFAMRASQLSDKDPNLHDTLAIVRLKRGKLDEADDAIERAILLDPANPTWRITKADILEAKGENEEAQALRERYRRQASN